MTIGIKRLRDFIKPLFGADACPLEVGPKLPSPHATHEVHFVYDIIFVFDAFQDIRGQFVNCAYMYMHFVFLSGTIQISIVDCSSHEVHFV